VEHPATARLLHFVAAAAVAVAFAVAFAVAAGAAAAFVKPVAGTGEGG